MVAFAAFAALLVASVTADEEVAKGELVVCVESAAFLADLDISESSTSDGSDPFVGVFIGDDLYTTSPQAGASAPAWNECFKAKGGAKYDVNTDISFVVVDADITSGDDIIGVACTNAATGRRVLELTGFSASDDEERGRLKVGVYLIADGAASRGLAFESVQSSGATPQLGQGAVSAEVACPASKRMVACQCWSTGDPGCKSARVYHSANGVDTCLATSNEVEDSPPLPPCPRHFEHGGSSETPYVTCAPEGWEPAAPATIRASARCADVADLVQATSEPSRITAGDATSVVCPSGKMMGCSSASAPGLGTRFEDEDSDATEECVGYSDGSEGVTVQASCATAALDDGQSLVGLAVRAETPIDEIEKGTETAVACPGGFELAGCSCYSDGGTCRGATFDSDDADLDLCRVSHALPRVWWKAGAEAHAVCVWRGESAALLGMGESMTQCSASGQARTLELPDKAWLPQDWRDQLRIDEDAGMDSRYGHHPGPFAFLLSTFFLCILPCMGCGLCASLFVTSLRARRQRQMGGAPTIQTARAIGTAVSSTSSAYPTAQGQPVVMATPVNATPVNAMPVSSYSSPEPTYAPPLVSSHSSSATAPLVLADSAQENSSYEPQIGSRI